MVELCVTVPDDIAARLASEAVERGISAEDLAADLIRKHVPAARERSLSFVGMFEGLRGAPSAAELERQLEDGQDMRVRVRSHGEVALPMCSPIRAQGTPPR